MVIITKKSKRSNSSGLALIATLWILAVLTMIVWGFTATAQGERQAAANYVDEARAVAAARAGIQRALLEIERMNSEYVSLDQPWTRLDSDTEGLGFVNAHYTVQGYDESAKVNLNVNVAELDRATFTNLVGEALTDAILDWRDADNNARPLGAERDYYASLSPPYRPRNGPLEALDELLLIKGLTPQMFFGSAAADQQLDLPLVARSVGPPARTSLPLKDLFTIYSQEDNTDAQGLARLNLNEATRDGLQRKLGDVLGAADIDNMLRYRDGDGGADVYWKRTKIDMVERLTDTVRVRLFEGAKIIRVDGKHSGQGGDRIMDALENQPHDFEVPSARPSQESPAPRDGRNHRTPRRQASGPAAVAEELTLHVTAAADGEAHFIVEAGAHLDALVLRLIDRHPFNNAGKLLNVPLSRDKVRAVADRVAVSNERTLTGRINLNTASVQLLKAIPGINEQIANDIAAYRQGATGPFRSVGDLLALPSVTNDVFKKIADRFTVRSNVFRFVSEGAVPGTKARKRIEIVAVLVTAQPAREVSAATPRTASNRTSPTTPGSSVQEVTPASRKAYVVYRRER